MPEAMVVVRLMGGLGNQLFQYAFGRALAIRSQVPLKLDISNYVGKVPDVETGQRIYCLKHFNIVENIASPADLTYPRHFDLLERVQRYADRYRPYYKRAQIVEPVEMYHRLDPNLLHLRVRRRVFLCGFWQSEGYFKDTESLIRSEFTVKTPPDAANAEMASRIQQTESVCVHIRHGDNANAVAPLHGVLPLDYYYTAADRIASEVAKPHFYVFSDDPDWAQANLHLNFPATFVTHNDDLRNYEDLRLMSLCHHHIIANSMFSWWGAWLGKKPGQIVYAPRKYHQHLDRPMPDLYPAEWRLL